MRLKALIFLIFILADCSALSADPGRQYTDVGMWGRCVARYGGAPSTGGENRRDCVVVRFGSDQCGNWYCAHKDEPLKFGPKPFMDEYRTRKQPKSY